MAKKLKFRSFWALAATVVLVGAYALIGYQFAPRLLRDQAISFVQKTYGRELTIGRVRIDPFRLQLEVHDSAFPDADGQSMLRLQRFMVDFEVSSLWHRAWVFKSIELAGPAVHAVLRNNGSINLADLVRSSASAPVDDSAGSALPRVWIQSLNVTDGKIEYVEAIRRQRPLVRKVAPITFALRDFRTTSEGGRFVLTARTAADEQFDWRGRFVLTPSLSSEGEFSVARLHATELAELMPETLPFDISSGLIRFNGRYEFNLTRTPTLNIQLPAFELSNLGIRPRGGDTEWITVPTIALENTVLNLDAKSLMADQLRVSGFKASAWMDADGSLNLQQLWDQPNTAADSTSDTRSSAWAVSVAGVDVIDAALDFEDRRQMPYKKFTANPLRVTLRNASLDLARAVPLTVDATINGNATLKIAGDVTPAPLSAALDISLQKVRLQTLQPYVLPTADLSIRSGTVSSVGRLTLKPDDQGESAIGFEGDVTFDALRSVDNVLKEDLLNFRRLQLQRLRLTTSPNTLRIERALLQEPYARLIISPEQVLNISAVLDPPGTATPAAPAPAVQSEMMPIRINEVQVQKGRMNFSDYNVRPNFSAEIRELSGTITALSSARHSRATVALTGNLGEFSPVTIAGTVQPFAFDRFTDIGLKFDNIALPIFNPYSGELAGYNISKGKLTTDLHYQIADRKLNATHHIRIDQLEWGEASEFKGEATLPVKFATGLLKDRHGVIKLDIPVSGSLDDPKLRMGPIVWQIIKNLIVKAVTSPFALLGSLFAGAEDAQFVDFLPGDATLDAATSERLAALAKGLAEKPDIALDIPIISVAEFDQPALLERRYQQQLATAIDETLRRRDADATLPPAYSSLPSARKMDALTAALRSHGGMPKIPDPPTAPEGTSRPEARALRELSTIGFLEQQLRERVVLQSDDMENLAQARAATIQGALLRSGELPASRVFLVRDGQSQIKDGRIRVQLTLK